MTRPKKVAPVANASSVANADRGEHELTLAGRTYLLRPSYTAIKAIETQTGASIVVLARRGNLGDLMLEQVGIIASEMIRAGAKSEMTRNVSAERIAELCYEEGLPHVTARLTLALIDAATGGRTASGEAKAAEAVNPEAPATAA